MHALRCHFLSFLAVVELLSFDARMKLLGFDHVCRWIEKCPVARRLPGPAVSLRIVNAVNRACVYYPKKALCLARSAVITRLLRQAGVSAKLNIGAQRMPFLMHAWVEVDRIVIDCDPNEARRFGVLWTL